MSTILDALKKSEQERKLNKIPTLADKPPPPERSKWPWILVGLCIVMLAVGMTVLFWQLNTQAQTAQLSETGVGNGTAASESQSKLSDDAVDESDAQPELKVSVVSFSADPSLRFVIVNDKLYREGDYLRAGLRVVEIQAESVRFDHRGEEIVRSP